MSILKADQVNVTGPGDLDQNVDDGYNLAKNNSSDKQVIH